MAKSNEAVVGKIDREQSIPGTRPHQREKDNVRYVSYREGEDLWEAFDKVTGRLSPPVASSGGVMLDECIITMPEGIRFYSLVLNGDVDGWRRQIEQGARELGLLTGKIVGNEFLVSDGRSCPLSACSVVQ
jgi:hypothetical protein